MPFKEFIRNFLLVTSIFITICSFGIGLAEYKREHCKPKSIIGLINLAWRAGCELSLERYDWAYSDNK